MFAAAAHSVIRDAETNTVSLIGLIDDLGVHALPGVLASIAVVFVLERETNDAERPPMLLRFFEGDRETQKFPISPDFQGKLRARAIITLNGLPISAPGKFKFGLSHADQDALIGSWEFPVNVIQPPVARTVTG